MNTENSKKPLTVTVAHAGNMLDYPPTVSLLENLLHNGHTVRLVSSAQPQRMPERLMQAENFTYRYVPDHTGGGVKGKIERLRYRKQLRAAVEECMVGADRLWTSTDATVKMLGDCVLKYPHILQLMELIRGIPRIGQSKMWLFPIDRYARAARKVVVPQIDRAYIQQVWWGLKEVPTVLPNKPYTIEAGEPLPEMAEALETIRNEKRKILLYLGVVAPDRNIEPFAEAIRDRDDYCLYLLGRPAYGHDNYLQDLLHRCPNIVYLGFYPTPKHLAFLPYAYIGLMPYMAKASMHYSELNALYCAPNKIFEYSAYGVPMIGTDVQGLRTPFERFDIGRCCKKLDKDTILQTVEDIEQHHDAMRENGYRFHESVNLDKIVEEILYD